ncbi:MAG: cyclophilin-like fold protein [Chordicoccus sp.]
MKKQLIGIVGLLLTLSIAMMGCSSSSGQAESSSSEDSNRVSSSQTASQSSEENDNIPSSNATELTVQFGDNGDSFVMHLEDNSTAAAIAGYVGTSDWRLPVYSYDESDVMEYYDVPSRYEIPDNSETVTEAHAGDVFYSDPNRIVLYYHDAEINEQYTRIGTFDATEEFVDAVENNPVLEGWGNQIVVISDGE